MYGQYNIPNRDTLINFDIGQPSTDFLPLDLIKIGTANINTIEDQTLLQYGDIKGYFGFRKDLSNFLTKAYSKDVNPDNLLITNGITGALSLICSLFTDSETIVYVEEPTYFLVINIFKNFKLTIVSIPIREDGIDIDILEEELDKTSAPKMLYTIPAFHNPTGYTMSNDKRERLGILSNKHNLLVVADEAYHLLYFNEVDKPKMPLTYYGDNIISLGSFSKILAPSLRLGWIHTNSKSIMDKIVNCGQLDSGGGISPFVSAIVHPLIITDSLEKHIKFLRQELKQRCDILCKTLKNTDPELTFNIPKGGYFLWADLNLNSNNLIDLFSTFKVKFNPGDKFTVNGTCENFIRLSFSCYGLADIQLGAERLLKMIKSYTSNINLYNVAVLGYRGHLGSEIVKCLKKDKAIARITCIGRELTYKSGNKNDVIIDVSTPVGTENLLNYLLDNEIYVPVVIGTTGDLPNVLIKKYSEFASISLVPNFSLGISVLTNFNKLITRDDWDIEICERHHTRKRDRPSGTALLIKECMGGEGEVRGEKKRDIPINSIREGDTLGEHKLTLTNGYEKLELNHSIIDYRVFGMGCVNFIKQQLNRNPGIHTLKNHGNESRVSLNRETEFYKYSVCGNILIMIEQKHIVNVDLEDFVIKICDKDVGVGADGVILYTNEKENNWSYYNQDGSLADFCGNGALCLTYHYLTESELLNVQFKNNYGIVTKGLLDRDEISITLNPIVTTLKLEFIDTLVKLLLTYRNNRYGLIFKQAYMVGVPHIIIETKLLSSININLFMTYLVTNSPLFLDYNINFINSNDNYIDIRTYERGVYRETGSCGSGSIAVAYYYKERYQNSIKIRTIGGKNVRVIFTENEITLSSDVKQLFKGLYKYI
uniref:Diaminopimelate epimerase n=1 Tax=viral metagenome TaxID=1070528 RepID=A0A6C0EJ63_9ZZZZ